jgi:hypothetical protein
LKPKILRINVFPNPVRSVANIWYTIPTNSKISINIYDVTGKLVKNLVNEQKQAGNYKIQLSKNIIPAGVYFVTLTQEQNKNLIQQNTKIILY